MVGPDRELTTWTAAVDPKRTLISIGEFSTFPLRLEPHCPIRLLAPLLAPNSSNVDRRGVARRGVYAENMYVGQQCERKGGNQEISPLLFAFGECLTAFAGVPGLSLLRIEIVVSGYRQ